MHPRRAPRLAGENHTKVAGRWTLTLATPWRPRRGSRTTAWIPRSNGQRLRSPRPSQLCAGQHASERASSPAPAPGSKTASSRARSSTRTCTPPRVVRLPRTPGEGCTRACRRRVDHSRRRAFQSWYVLRFRRMLFVGRACARSQRRTSAICAGVGLEGRRFQGASTSHRRVRAAGAFNVFVDECSSAIGGF